MGRRPFRAVAHFFFPVSLFRMRRTLPSRSLVPPLM